MEENVPAGRYRLRHTPQQNVCVVEAPTGILRLTEECKTNAHRMSNEHKIELSIRVILKAQLKIDMMPVQRCNGQGCLPKTLVPHEATAFRAPAGLRCRGKNRRRLLHPWVEDGPGPKRFSKLGDELKHVHGPTGAAACLQCQLGSVAPTDGPRLGGSTYERSKIE
jgi:hypothetical protein